MNTPQRLVLAAGPPAAAPSSIFFVGTATVILRHAGFTLLTDPNFLHKGDHVHLGYGFTSERLTEPAIDLDALPPIDLVLLSHLHGDHFDQLVAQKLDRTLPIVSTPEAVRGLREMGFRATHPLRTWEALEVEKGDARMRITAAPARHGPPVVAGLLPETMGSVLDFPGPAGRDLRMYISGDTLVYDDLHEIPKRFPGVDIALLHLGGTRLLGILITMDGRQGVDAIRIVTPRQVVPIHNDDYTVFKSPLSDFLAEVDRAGLAQRVRTIERGETYAFDLDAIRRGAAARVAAPQPAPQAGLRRLPST
jgi:L-ascorbate metabolism protein UlaG (beta-lactamase superfamily)